MLELLEGGGHCLVGDQGATPIPFEREQALGEVLRVAFAQEIATVFPQDIEDRRVRVPAEGAPHDFVHIVVAAFRISHEANSVRLQPSETTPSSLQLRVGVPSQLSERCVTSALTLAQVGNVVVGLQPKDPPVGHVNVGASQSLTVILNEHGEFTVAGSLAVQVTVVVPTG